MAADKEAFGLSRVTCTNLSVSCPYEIIVYSVIKHINTARMHTISRQFIPLDFRLPGSSTILLSPCPSSTCSFLVGGNGGGGSHQLYHRSRGS